MIYLDYAATSPMKDEVLEEMLPYFKQNFANPDSVHAFGRDAALAVTRARDRIAEVLNVRPDEVYFTSGGTEADNFAVRHLGRGRAFVSKIEHAAVLSSAPLREGGCSLFDVEPSGVVSAERVKEELPEDAGLVCLMKVNNETGCIQPVEELSDFLKERGCLLFSDCVQAAAFFDLKEIVRYADAISLSAHKIGGPKGVGALIVKRGCALKPLIVGGEQERGLRGGTLNVAGIVGFSCALKSAQAEREKFERHTRALRDFFEGELKKFPSVVVDGENRAPNLSHITFLHASEAILQLLDLNGIAASGGAACSAHAALPSHVMIAMGREETAVKRGVRFSFGLETTKKEIQETLKILSEILL